jgi:hypothetical protein
MSEYSAEARGTMAESSIRQQVAELLVSYIHPDYAEFKDFGKVERHIVELAARASEDAAGVLLEIEQLALRADLSSEAIRTRRVKFTELGETAIGLAVYNSPIVKNKSTEILTCLLPAKGSERSLGFYVSGVENDASGLTLPLDHKRCGVPVLRAILEVSSENRNRVVELADWWLAEGLARCT